MAARLNKGFFTKVRVARELLREQADQILKDYLEVVAKARDAGDYETAAKALQWLIEHMPSEDDGSRVLDPGIDKQQQQIQAPVGPGITIGIAIGGTAQQSLEAVKPKELPIDAEVIREEH